MNQKFTVEPGNRVGYWAKFLQSIGVYGGDMAFGVGTVKEVLTIGQTQLAVIEWDAGYDLPRKVNVQNLAVVGTERWMNR